MNAIVKCLKCKQVLNESSSIALSERIPCPTCGSLSRQVECSEHEDIALHDLSHAKGYHGNGKNGGKGEPFIKIKSGDSLYRKTNKWNKLKRITDVDNNWYEEVITDPETGEIIRECKGPLDQHQGYGSAKYKKKC